MGEIFHAWTAPNGVAEVCTPQIAEVVCFVVLDRCVGSWWMVMREPAMRVEVHRSLGISQPAPALDLLSQRVETIGHAIRLHVHQRVLFERRQRTGGQPAVILAQVRTFIEGSW